MTRRFEALRLHIGQVQIAWAPDRGKLDHGELDYGYVLSRMASLGWVRPIRAEYLPENVASPDLAWLARYR